MRTLRYDPPDPPAGSSPSKDAGPRVHTGRWRINGFGATLLVWTDEEWRLLQHRPADAQRLSCGVWCALRIDD